MSIAPFEVFLIWPTHGRQLGRSFLADSSPLPPNRITTELMETFSAKSSVLDIRHLAWTERALLKPRSAFKIW
ncbi:hypothetical protein D3C84_1184960 [compost metagenome]